MKDLRKYLIEASISEFELRKYISGLVKFLGVKDCPQSVWVNVSQELD